MNQITSPSIPATATPNEQDDDALDLGSYLDFLIENRWLIGLVALVIALAGVGYALIATPIYRANILIQVEDSASSPSNVLGDLAGVFDIKTAATAEMEILRSRFVVGRAVENTHLYIDVRPNHFPVFGEWIARRSKQLSEPGLLGMGGYVWGREAAQVSLFDVPEELEGERFMLTAEGEGRYRLTQDDAGIDLTGRAGELLKAQTDFGEITLQVDRLIGNAGAEFRLTRLPKLKAIQDLQKELAIAEKGKQSGMLEVALEGADPRKTAAILNELGFEYIRQNVDRKSEEAEKSLAFLEKQLPELKKNLEQSEAKYNAMRNTHSTFDMGEEAKSVLQQSVLAQSRLAELQQKRAELLTRFQENNPVMDAVNQQIRAANAQINAINGQIKKLPAAEQDVFRLTRDVKVNTDLYTSLLNSAQQLRLIKASKIGNARLLDAATKPLEPVRPKRAIVVGLALLIGLFAGVVCAFVRKSLTAGVTDPHEVEELLGLPVSAAVPHSDAQLALYKQIENKARKISILAYDVPEDGAVESLRSFRTSFQFSMLSAANNVVMVTGPTPSLGKSFISVNLGAVLASTGKRVLLIDGDLRKGYLHRYLGLERANGLSEIIAGSISIEDAMHRGVGENMDFISTGVLPPRSAELLSHPRFGEIMRTLSSAYDFVIIDTAPVLAVSDALVVANHAGTIYTVARAANSTIGEIEEAVKRIRQTGNDVAGVIFNDLKPRIGRYGYGSRYGKYRYAQYKY